MPTSDVREGLLYGGLPYRAAGAGQVAVVFPGLETTTLNRRRRRAVTCR